MASQQAGVIRVKQSQRSSSVDEMDQVGERRIFLSPLLFGRALSVVNERKAKDMHTQCFKKTKRNLPNKVSGFYSVSGDLDWP